MRMRRISVVASVAALAAGGVVAEPLSGAKTISLIDGAGAATAVAEVTFAPAADGSIGYQIDWREAPFEDHFLSMRPFKCLEGPAKHWCRVPYPYEIRRQVSATDLVDLEYDLLFLWKGATEYGVNMWNGVYYRLEIDGDRLVGRIHEMDMEKLGVPPEEGELRPVREVDLEEGDADSHWLPTVVIK